MSWYREGEELSLIHTPPVNAPYYLPVPVYESGTYTCEAVNPVSSSKTSVTVGQECAVPVLAPNVSVTHAEHPCKLLCTVERGTQINMSWYREGEELSLIHTPPVNAPYYLPVPVYESGTYTCEAVNPVSSSKTSVTVGEECAVKAQPCPGSEVTAYGVAVGIAIGVITAIIFLAVFVGLKSYGNPNFIKELKKLLIVHSDASSPVNRGEQVRLSSPVNEGWCQTADSLRDGSV
ncbi:hypothetical protein AGOR_G00194890 [Albula goreensis]|uniref:Ig-like domain-containing protein n=1 Tax=Albula goreensis TaxID=1534307 RepID=A0A8T3CX24_9TELE|nr:hypothetical protein AGOR_G00194890 [Albula goreensis]